MSEWETIGKVGSPSNDGWETVGPVSRETPTPFSPSETIQDPTKQTGFETQLQGAAAGVEHYLGKAVEPVAEKASMVAQFIAEETPDEVKNAIQQTNQAIMQQPTSRAYMSLLKQGGAKLKQFEQDYPRVAADVRAAGAILGLAGGAGVFGKRAGKSMFDNALSDSVQPYMNQANLAEMISDGRMAAGKGTKFRFVETAAVKAQKKALRTVEGIRPAQTNITRYGLVNDEIINASKRLEQRFDAMPKTGRGIMGKNRFNAALSKKQVKNRFNSDQEFKMQRSQFMNDAEYDSLVRDIKFSLVSKRADGAILIGDIHRLRKEIDHTFRQMKGQRRANGDLLPSREEMIWRTKRSILNNMVDRMAPAAKAERARMSTLYDVREVLHQKATKGQIYFYKDVTDKLPLVGDSKIKMIPTTGK